MPVSKGRIHDKGVLDLFVMYVLAVRSKSSRQTTHRLFTSHCIEDTKQGASNASNKENLARRKAKEDGGLP